MNCGNKCWHICEKMPSRADCYVQGSEYLTCHTGCMTNKEVAEPLVDPREVPPAVANDQECSLNSASAVAHSVNAAMEIWAADLRCSGSVLEDAPVKCTQDVAGAIEELTQVAIAVGDMAGTCGDLKLDDMACQKAGDEVFASTAGLTKAGAAIADKCAGLTAHDATDHALDTATLLGKCTADAAGSMNTFFAAHNSIQKLKKSCDDQESRACKVDALDVTAVLSDWGAYIAEAYRHCDMYNRHGAKADQADDEAECAAAVLEGVADLTRMADLGLGMHKACAKASRLYLDEKIASESSSSPSMTLALAASIPVAAVLSFIAGSRFAKSRQQVDARDA